MARRRGDTAPRHGAHAQAGAHAAAPARPKRGWTVVFVIAVIVLVAALAVLAALGISYLQGRQEYASVAESVDANDVLATLDQDAAGAVGSGASDDGALAAVTLDWNTLRAVNPDVVGWIYIPGTTVNYPIVQRDNSYYLRHDFRGSTGWLAQYGAIFLDENNASDFSDAGVFIYGHHMNDGSMFAPVDAMSSQSEFDAHRTVYVLTPEKNYRLRTFAIVHCAGNARIVQTAFSSDAERAAYLGDMVQQATASSPDAAQVAGADRFFALVTCDNAYTEGGRYVLYCTVDAEEDAGGADGGLAVADDVVAAGDAASIDDAAADEVG